MTYATLDIEKDVEDKWRGQYDVVVSTNCIHATRDLVRSTSHIGDILRPDGVLCLVELTRNVDWLDLVFGLLEGWWLFEDGRKHVLADEGLWRRQLSEAGFRWVDWTDGPSKESDILRVITASRSPRAESVGMETLPFKQVDGVTLQADIYYPKERDPAATSRPIGECPPGFDIES
jgi:SAM-dependent methyltransferase